MPAQHISPRDTAERLRDLGCQQNTLFEFAGISPALGSHWLTGKRGLSLEAQLAVNKVLRFMTELADSRDVPIDFSNVEAIRPHWEAFLAREEDVIKLAFESAG